MTNTPRRSFRASDALWSAAQARAAREGDELSTILVRALLEYARDDDARLTPLPAGAVPNALPCESCQAPIGTPCVAGCFGAPPDYPSTREADQDAPGAEVDGPPPWREVWRDVEAVDYPSTREAEPTYQDAPGADEPCLCAAFPARHARSDHTRG